MKYSEIEFEKIILLQQDFNRLKVLLNEDYHTLREEYMDHDDEFIDLFRRYRTLHSDLRKLDFVHLTDCCFRDRNYIYNRMKKMDKGFKCLINLQKIKEY